MSRRRGAQKGNLNALKHGFYSSRMDKMGVDDIDAALNEGLHDEIAMLRVVMKRVFDTAADEKVMSLEKWSYALSTLATASAKLAGLLRTQQLLGSDGSEVADALTRALSEVTSGLGNFAGIRGR